MICLHAFRMPAREGEEAFFSDPPEPADLLYRQRSLSCIPLLPSAAAPTSPIPQEGRIITSDDVFGHLPDIRCINGGIDAAPAPPLDGAGQCAGLPGVLSEAGGRLPLHPKTRRSRAARYFGLPDKEISSGAVVMRWPAHL